MTKITVTIGIPAHNEANSIGQLLTELLKQKTQISQIKAIYVLCDGCTDETATIVKKFTKKHSLIKLIDDGKQKYKIGRLTQLYQLCKTDAVISFDADIRLASNDVVEKLITGLTKPHVGMVSLNDQPEPGSTFFGKAVVAGIKMWEFMRESINDGDSVHNSHGCALAIKTNLAKKIIFPKSPIGDDEFIYFAIKKQGFSLNRIKEAKIYYKAPQNFHDYITQSKRFLDTKRVIESHFGEKVYKDEQIPKLTKLKAIIKTIYVYPIYGSLIIMFQVGLHILVPLTKVNYQNWKPVRSTKS